MTDIASRKFDDFSSSKKRQRRLSTIALCIGLLAALVVGARIIGLEKKGPLSSGIARVKRLEGKVMIKRGAQTVEYEDGLIVMAGDAFQTIGQASVEIIYLDDGTRVTLGDDTQLLFNASNDGKRTNLSAGTVKFDVPAQPDGRPMVLASYNAEATVLEPGRLIQNHSNMATHFDVISGRVRVRRFSDGLLNEVTAGQGHTCRNDVDAVIKFQPDGLK